MPPRIPKWLSESVALYESIYIRSLDKLSYIKAGNFPTISELDDKNCTKIYDVGTTIIEYIIDKWG